MSRTQLTRSRRSAFTLVELIVVMTIIAILIGLLVSAVQKARIRAKQVQAVNDIQQLSMAVEAFKSRYEVSYLPSRIILRNNMNAYNLNNPLEADSVAILTRMWPRIQASPAPPANLRFSATPLYNPQAGAFGWFPQDPNGPTAQSAYLLEGDQCLVFFLGGIQQNGGTRGFSTDRNNPTNLNAPAEALLYDFPTARLGLAATPGTNTPAGPRSIALSFFDSYAAMPPTLAPPVGNDPKCRPYVYFTSQNGNDYCKYGSSDCFCTQQIPPANDAFPTAVNTPVYPYAESATKFINSNGFQILCAGRDRAFGGGRPAGAGVINNSGVGVLWPVTAGYGDLQAGSDDLSNFSKRLLSEPTNN
jgi:prepilin-type N-terminal cleavage/methylation domain-containing protein